MDSNPVETIRGAASKTLNKTNFGTPETKQSIRERVWRNLEENRLARFPRPAYNRIPNFKGSFDAAERLRDLEQFRKAKTVLVSIFF